MERACGRFACEIKRGESAIRLCMPGMYCADTVWVTKKFPLKKPIVQIKICVPCPFRGTIFRVSKNYYCVGNLTHVQR